MVDNPVARGSAFRGLSNSNPFYLISACCMLLGCLMLTNSLSWMSIPRSRLLILLTTLNFYEAALIGLAWFLILKRKIRRDGMMLLVLEAFFLVDITFLNAEISAQSLSLGLGLGIAVFILATVKLLFILRSLEIDYSASQFAFILIEIAAVLGLPLVFARIDHGNVSQLAFYIAWWVVAALPAGYLLLQHSLRGENATPASNAMRLYLTLPWLSLVAHLGILHYVYDVSYSRPDAAPILLALTIVLMCIAPNRFVSREALIMLKILLPAAALMVSSDSPAGLTLYHGAHFTLDTMHAAIGAAYLTGVYSLLRRFWLPAILLGIATATAVVFGPTIDQIELMCTNAWNTWKRMALNVMPTTSTGWGCLAVAGSFVFLGIGAWVSLARPVSEPSIAPEALEETGQ